MNQDGWLVGVFFGTAAVFALEVSVRALLFRRRHKKHAHCEICEGCLEADGRAVGALEKLQSCAQCGDTWPTKLDGETPAAEATTRELQALVQDLPPAPKAGDKVSLDAAVRRLTRQ